MCVRKKIETGVHSVSEGVESIWDEREVEVLDVDGMGKILDYSGFLVNSFFNMCTKIFLIDFESFS